MMSVCALFVWFGFFFFKQKTAYEMRISDWSSDVCSSDLENMLLGEGRGFEIAQGRLGPGRIHHCMRTIGLAEEILKKMVERLLSRTAFGKRLAEHSIWEQRIAEARTSLEMT